ncbi:MAG: DNA-binding protein [Bacteroidetes bacterium GWF2_41_61]|jgi:cold shock CspA family protein|nr:MAG: DNA-binding protein [Bacteroidetes bacterium GWF2_41_61]OFY89134.1 MAG: DNA-binding protein [Bacteroidetes bacterium RIFOXYA12_FULL_40_10]PKP06566.1 MAG: DNA-binding protein [Bacteroidetes bacterium HGW-Bacteroidetes-5]HBG24921.1 DNA-binding protein [Rikenellaceae bacterium]
MAKSQVTFNKREKEKKRLSKRVEKQQKKEDRKASAPGGGLENMLAFVDENGMITDTPPDPSKKIKIKAENIEVSIPKREREEKPALRKGRVEFFNSSKGFGFIKELETQEKFFVHVHGLLEDIAENNIVSFEIERGIRGMNAFNVKKWVDMPKPAIVSAPIPEKESDSDSEMDSSPETQEESAG